MAPSTLKTTAAIAATLLTTPAALAFEDASKHFKTRQAYIDHLNAQPGRTWTAGVSDRFRGLPIGHSKTLCGAKTMDQDELQKLYQSKKVSPKLPQSYWDSLPAPPDTFDSATHWPDCKDTILDIRDQSDCGCCWAFGAAGAASDRMCIATNGTLKVPLSAQQLCFCASNNGCMGSNLYLPWQHIQTNGLATGGQFNNTGPLQPPVGDSPWCADFSLPHCHHHGPQRDDPFPDEGTKGCPKVVSGKSPECPSSCDKDSARTLADDTYNYAGSAQEYGGEGAELNIRKAIYQNGPLEAAFTVFEDFEQYTSGVYQMHPETSGKVLGGHAVRIVGWGSENGTKYWKIANSWNPHWGESGYFRILRSDSGAGTNGPGCQIELNVWGSTPNAVWSKKK